MIISDLFSNYRSDSSELTKNLPSHCFRYRSYGIFNMNYEVCHTPSVVNDNRTCHVGSDSDSVNGFS